MINMNGLWLFGKGDWRDLLCLVQCIRMTSEHDTMFKLHELLRIAVAVHNFGGKTEHVMFFMRLVVSLVSRTLNTLS